MLVKYFKKISIFLQRNIIFSIVRARELDHECCNLFINVSIILYINLSIFVIFNYKVGTMELYHIYY